MDYIIAKWLHILSSTLLFGTGIGTAYYFFFASLTRNPPIMAAVARNVVTADWAFTATTMVIQPLTGFYLVYLTGIPLTSRWIMWSTGLYLLAGACWVPVVWLQIRMHYLASHASRSESELPALYWRYFRLWIALGIPAFVALVIVFYLMVAKPA
ncbi:DUF2269 domain-containing protein [Nitrosovibrio sp. Nv6]|uniref:DUF2269 family protein n=1 Tax=Nitrosovibrio sp. Nv6 TaxID=1855340 RepID=UPI0008C4BCDA|nr:DUF2269 domain-containing protein [Nitrosovibrio sp. Nv6]SEO83066.1 Uncharacterized membrane protein [Nitrosovibrio sp. Nv6]